MVEEENEQPSLASVHAAYDTIKGLIHQTPVMTCNAINQLCGGGRKLYFKCENLQKTGSFKPRGATNALSKLSSDVQDVVTHSSGR